jgi:RND superfamily putative drug exporter
MRKLTDVVLRHKLLVTLLWVLLAAAGGVATVQLDEHLTGQLDQPGQPGFETNQAIVDTYRTGGEREPYLPVITLPAGARITDPATKSALDKAFTAVERSVKARVVSYVDTGNQAFVSPDGRSTFALVYPPAKSGSGGGGGGSKEPAITQTLRAELPAEYGIQVTGMPTLEGGGGGGGLSVVAETLIGGLGALLVLAFVFRSLLAFLPLLVALFTIPTSFLLVYGLTMITDVSQIVQFIVALIGLGVAIDYSLLLVTRWREERFAGRTGDDAVRAAMETAGKAVVSSGATVAIGLFAMVVLPVPFLRSIGYGGLLIPVVSVLAVLTLLPVVLAKAGPAIDRPRPRGDVSASRGWTGWARRVVRFRWAAVAVSTAALLLLAGAALGLRLGEPESTAMAGSGSAKDGLVRLQEAKIPTGVLTPFEVLVPAGTDPAEVAGRLAGVPGVLTAVAPDRPTWRGDGTALVAVLPADEGGSDAGKDTVTRIRDAVPAGVRVGGAAAQSMDFTTSVYGAFPVMLGLIALATFLFLAHAFRSIVLPLKAILLNLLSLAAIVGAMVLVWQYGYGSKPVWNISGTGSITEFIPVMVFAFLYGLSMDYEVFILARIREEYDRTGSTETAVVRGIGRTGRLVTSAALVLFLAFASLASAPAVELKMFATGLGLGVLLDATVIRALLVPALVAVLGRWNWWLPPTAARILRIRTDRRADATPREPANV